MRIMNKLGVIVGFVALLGWGLWGITSAQAREGEVREHGGMCGHHRGMMGKMDKGEGKNQCPVVDAFTKKTHFLLEHKTDLALTEDQTKAIKALKLEVEKDSLRQNAEAGVFVLDLRSKLAEDKIDVAGTDAIIDKSFADMAQATKSNVDAYAKLKDTLTPEQLAKMKDIWKNKETEKEEEAPSKNKN